VNGEASKAASLVADIQKLVEVRKEKGLKTFVVFMGGPELKDPISKIAAERQITIPMTFLPKGAAEADIAAYKINATTRNTVLLWKGGTIVSNFVDVDNKSFVEVTKAVDEMLK
jgi:hypothetical protein